MSDKVLLLPNGPGEDVVLVSTIQYIQSDLKMCKVVTVNGAYTIRRSLRSFEHSLPGSQFLRIHKRYIVSIHFIHSVGKEHLTIAGTSLPVAPKARPGLRNRFQKYN